MFDLKTDNGGLALEDAETLLREIELLRTKVAELEKLVCELDGLAHIDALVGLPNRRSFLNCLDQLIARVNRYGGPAAVLFVDLDDLKSINDRFGHEAGDAALAQVAQMLVATTRKADCIARIGGDEFAILLEHSDELNAWTMALRITETIMSLPLSLEDTNVGLSVAVGVAVLKEGDTARSAMNRADQCMYRIKNV